MCKGLKIIRFVAGLGQEEVHILRRMNRVRLLLPSSVLMVFIVLYLVSGCTRVPGNLNGSGARNAQHRSKKERKLQNETTVMTSGSAHYPNIPKEILSPIGKVIVLTEAKSKQDIVAWAENATIAPNARLMSIWTQDPEADWLVVMYIGTSGLRSWTVHLYANCPVSDGDKKPWKLLYLGIGAVDTSRYDKDIECIYIDKSKKSLVFGKRTGEVIKTIPIVRELDFIKSHQIKGDKGDGAQKVPIKIGGM